MKRISLLAVLLAAALTACEVPTALDSPGPVETRNGSATLVVANQTSTDVFFMYISPCSSTTWGEDRLGPFEVIPSGARRSWTLTAGCYDVRAEFSDYGFAADRLELESGVEFTWSLWE